MWIDIHAHILPGIDDGSPSWDVSLEMARIAVEGGTSTIVCTNHTNIPNMYENYESKKLRRVFDEFQLYLMQEKIYLNIVRGNEIFVTNNIREILQGKRVIPLNEKRYYLVEFPFDSYPEYIEEMLMGMMADGYHPIIAHPERYYCIQDFPGFIFKWMKNGVLTQINKGSVMGRFGRRVQNTAEILLEHNLVSVIASDAHGDEARTPYMGDIARMFSDNGNGALFWLLAHENPQRILFGERIQNRGIMPIIEKAWY